MLQIQNITQLQEFTTWLQQEQTALAEKVKALETDLQFEKSETVKLQNTALELQEFAAWLHNKLNLTATDVTSQVLELQKLTVQAHQERNVCLFLYIYHVLATLSRIF